MSASFLLASSFPALSIHPAFSQGITTGTITGSVVDPSGAMIPGATVTALRPSTGVKETLTTDGKGEFSFRNVQAGTYNIMVDAPGFAAKTEIGVSVAAGQVSALAPTQMVAGSVATDVEVKSTAELLQTTSSEIATNFEPEQVQDLPLSGNLDNLAELLPGVAQGHDESFSNSNGDNFSINGQRSRSNNYEIDGQSNNDNSVAGPQIFFTNQDALQSVQIITSNFNAEYGRNMGGVINYLTKEGTNAFHGSGYEYFTGDFLQSYENGEKNSLLGYCAAGENPSDGCQVPNLPKYVDNRYGGTLGGPILKDKLWFFGSTGWDHTRQGFTPTIPSNPTPTTTGLQQLAAAFPNNPAVVALTTQGPYAVAGSSEIGSTVSTRNITGPNGVTIPVQFSKFSSSVAPTYHDEEELGRIDWQPTTSDHFFARYIYQATDSTGNSLGNGYYYNVPGATHSIGADYAHTFSANWVNQLRYSFQQSKLFFQGGTQPDCSSTTLADCVSSISITGGVGLGYADNLPQGRTVKVTEVQDNANWTHANHSISFGGDFTYQNSPNTFLPYYNGAYTFSSFSNFLQQTGNLTLGNGNPVIPFTEPDFGLYIQDEWKVSPSLTLNMGFRYEFFDEAVNILHNETVARESGPGAFWNTALPLAERTYGYTNQNWKNLQPRLGFAFNPQSMRHLVVRGAYGIQYDPAFYNIFLNSATAAPVINLGTIACTGNCIPGGGATGANVRALNLPSIPTGGNPNARNQTNNPSNFNNPRAQTYNLGMEFDYHSAVIGVTYVGNHVSRQFQSLDSNPYLLPVSQAFPSIVAPGSICEDPTQVGYGRTSCGEGNVRTRANTSFSNYNSLQVQFQTRQYHGATISSSYTYSRVINNADEIFASTTGGGSQGSPAFSQNPFNTDLGERGVANYSYPNLASAGINYNVPNLVKNGLGGRLLGGFEFSTVWAFNNGESYTPTQYDSASTFTDPTGNAALNTTSYCDNKFAASFNGSVDLCRPVLSNAAAPLGSVGIYVIDPTHAFTTGGTGYYNYSSTDANGNLNQPITKAAAHWLYNNQAYANLVGNPYDGAPRNITRGQGYNNVDASIIKNTKLREGVDLKLYLNALNVLNHSFLGTPDGLIDDAASGSFANNAYNTGNQRTVQIGGKIVF